MRRLLVDLIAVSLLPCAALATDGVLEINQTCATSPGGCFSGDASGHPVQIAQPGSYRLTSDLIPGNATGIVIASGNVSLDLGGFSIRGGYVNGACSADPDGSGVRSDSNGVVVRNGSVRTMTQHGVILSGNGSRIEAVVAESNCSSGLVVGNDGLVIDAQALSNGAFGIVLGQGGVVTRSTAVENRQIGVLGTTHNQFSLVTARENGGTGISAGEGSVVAQCSASFNPVGIGGSALVRDSNASHNDSVGISAYAVSENVTTDNGTAGISATHRLACNVENGVKVCP